MADLNAHRQNIKEKADRLINIEPASPLNTILNQEKLELFSALGDTIFIDDESLIKLKYIENRLQTTVMPDSILYQLDNDIAIQHAIASNVVIPTKARTDAATKEGELMAQKNSLTGPITARRPQFTGTTGITEKARNFETNILEKNVEFPTVTSNEIILAGATPPPTAKNSESLQNKMVNGATGATYDLYDKDLSKLSKDGSGNYILTLPKKGGGDIKVGMKGLSITGTPPTVRFNMIELLDPTSAKDIRKEVDLSKEIELPIGASFNVGGGKNIAHMKTIKFKLKDTVSSGLSDAAQRARYDIFNISGKPIGEYVEDFYDNNYKEVEDRFLDEMIGDAATDENKKVLRERIKNLIAGGKKVSPFVKNQKEIIENFKEHFFANRKPTDDDISTTSKFNDFLKKNIPEHLKGYLEQELKRQMESTAIVPAGAVAPFLPATRDLHDKITNDILKYRQEQEEHGRDSFTDSKNLRKKLQTNKKLRSPGLTRPRLLGKRDVSYMRFFTNQTQEIGKQQMKLVTDEKKNKVEFTGYDATLKIGSVDNLTMEIKMDNGEEFAIKAGNHIALIDSILNEPGIPYGKMRVHMAYNMIKAMIKVANKNNITLEYAVGKKINILSIDEKDDIVLETIDDKTGKKDRKNLFSEKKFDAENDMHQLRSGLENCLGQFNKSMEKVHDQYKEATDKKLFGYFSLSRAKFPVSRFDSPIKKLMNIRKNRTLDFNFEDTKVEGIEKNVSISFSKNVFTITSDLFEKPISSKNLGKLLNTRIDGKRIFDGMERAISGTVYQNMISKLRKNVKLANTNFGVKDPVKNRIYFLDKAGEVGYISLANNKNPIAKSITRMFKHEYGTIKKLPSTGRMLTKEQAQKELYQNPFIMGKLMKAMNQRLYSF